MAIDSADLELLTRAARTGEPVQLVVTACLYSCCGKGWQPREGYEQTYHGTVSLGDGTFTVTSKGIGTISYVLMVAAADVVDVQPRS